MFKTYNDLITFAVSRNWNRNSYEYLELHHILPKNMGGDDSPENLVFLKVGEHVEAHYLFAMEHQWNKKVYYANLNAAWIIIHGKTLGSNIRSQYISDWLKDKDNQDKLSEIKLLLRNQPRPKRNIEKQPHYWMALNTRYPSYVTEKSIFKYLQKGYIRLNDCPICHNSNSESSFACCKEHEEQYILQKKQEYKTLKAEQTRESWTRPEDRELRIKNSLGKNTEKGKFFWATNGVEDIQIFKGEDIPDGYIRGRSKNIPTPNHTNESKRKQSERRKNCCYVWKDNINCKEIQKSELDDYLSQGWHRGKKPGTVNRPKGFKQPKMAWVNKNGETLKIRADELDKYISNGYSRGRGSQS